MNASVRTALLFFAIGVAVAAASDPARQVLVVLVLAVGPGLAVGQVLGIKDRVTLAAVVVPISLAIDMVIATIWIYLGIWSPVLILFSIAVLVVLTALSRDNDRMATGVLVVIGALPAALIVVGGQ